MALPKVIRLKMSKGVHRSSQTVVTGGHFAKFQNLSHPIQNMGRILSFIYERYSLYITYSNVLTVIQTSWQKYRIQGEARYCRPNIAEFAKIAEKNLRNFSIFSLNNSSANIAEFFGDFFYKLCCGRHE